MSLSSLRLTLLSMVARVLRGWLDRVTARLDAVAAPAAPPESTQRPDPRQPPPPDHWVDLVRQHAPQLLQADANAPGVIDYRADEALIDPPERVVPLHLRQPPPLHLLTPRHRPVAPPLKIQPGSKRPLRLEQVSVQPAADEFLVTHSPLTANESSLASSPSSLLAGVLSPQSEANYRPTPASPDEQPRSQTSEIPPSANLTKRTPARSPEFSVTQQPIHTTLTDMPANSDVPFVRSRPGDSVLPPQRQTSIPAPAQVVFRPTTTHSPLNISEITPDRWPSLPDLPAEEPYDSSAERQRRERLRREQEGRAWSE